MRADARPARGGHGVSVEIKGLTKRYGDFYAVRGVDLFIREGEFITLLGPSGSGKTTILNILAGFVRPDDGTVLVGGEPIDDVPTFQRDFGVVFQNYALFPHMTVKANVAFPLRMRGAPEAEAADQVERTLALVGLSEHGTKLPAQLSGGQQQRVALARALVYAPRLILMDEPLSALDRGLREALKVELKDLHAKIGATIIYVTHDQGEALTMSDRIAVLRHGQLLACDDPQALYRSPPNLFVATFLGASNCITGTVSLRGDGTVSVTTEHGWSVEAVAARPMSNDDPAVVMLRPEHGRIVSVENGQLVGSVERVTFLGEIVALQVRLQAGGELQIRAQNIGNVASLKNGSAIGIAWDANAWRALPPGEEANRDEA